MSVRMAHGGWLTAAAVLASATLAAQTRPQPGVKLSLDELKAQSSTSAPDAGCTRRRGRTARAWRSA